MKDLFSFCDRCLVRRRRSLVETPFWMVRRSCQSSVNRWMGGQTMPSKFSAGTGRRGPTVTPTRRGWWPSMRQVTSIIHTITLMLHTIRSSMHSSIYMLLYQVTSLLLEWISFLIKIILNSLSIEISISIMHFYHFFWLIQQGFTWLFTISMFILIEDCLNLFDIIQYTV